MVAHPVDARFVGVWRLEAIRDRLPDGRVEDPPDFGPHPDGLLIYTASGHVSVQFMRRGRLHWKKEDDPTDEERGRAARSYGAYAGRFDVDRRAGVVRHHVETALIPNRVGQTLERHFSFSEEQLTLQPPRVLRNGLEVDRTLMWRRVG